MILPNIKLIIYGVAAAAAIGAFTWIYFQGKEEAREECLADQAKVMELWNKKLSDAEEKNAILAENLAITLSDLEKSQNARTKKIIKYVKDDPDADTVIFDNVGLQLLNEAQRGDKTPGG